MDKIEDTRVPIETHGEDDRVVVKFKDGVFAIFVPYSHGIGYQIEGLRNFILTKDDKILCKINSRLYRNGPQKDEHKIEILSSELTREDIVEYWEKAKDFITGKFYFKGKDGENYKFTDDKYWYLWRVATEGYFDLQHLKEGKMERYIKASLTGDKVIEKK